MERVGAGLSVVEVGTGTAQPPVDAIIGKDRL